MKNRCSNFLFLILFVAFWLSALPVSLMAMYDDPYITKPTLFCPEATPLMYPGHPVNPGYSSEPRYPEYSGNTVYNYGPTYINYAPMASNVHGTEIANTSTTAPVYESYPTPMAQVRTFQIPGPSELVRAYNIPAPVYKTPHPAEPVRGINYNANAPESWPAKFSQYYILENINASSKKFLCNVEGCEKRYTRNSDLLNAHMQLHHPHEFRAQYEGNYAKITHGCLACGCRFSRKKQLSTHEKKYCQYKQSMAGKNKPAQNQNMEDEPAIDYGQSDFDEGYGDTGTDQEMNDDNPDENNQEEIAVVPQGGEDKRELNNDEFTRQIDSSLRQFDDGFVWEVHY